MHEELQTPKLTQRMLEVFAAVMVHAGISTAARALDISQPSVSRLIEDLERATGLVLFVKRGRSIVATAHGNALFAQVERSFIGLRDISHFARQLKYEQRGRLSVGSLPALGSSLMPGALSELRQSHPQTTIYLQIETSLAIAQMVAALQIDIGFVAAGTYPTGVQKIAGLSGPCKCILPPGHPLGKNDSVDISELADHPFIALSSHSRIRNQLETLAPEASAKLQVIAEMRQSASASELVLKNAGISIVDPFVAMEHVNRGGASIPLEPRVKYEIDVIAHADSRPPEAARELIGVLKRLSLQ